MRIPVLVVGALLAAASVAAAHDFWLVPNAFTVSRGETLDVSARTSSRFPTSESAVAPERVKAARLISAGGESPITDLSVAGKSLRLRHRPDADGQYVVAVALVPRESRTTPERLQRYIALEGAPALAARYQKDGAYPRADSVVQVVSKYAKTIIEVGRGGPAAYTRRADHPLEIVPLNDARQLAAGDSLRVQVLYRGQPLRGAELFAGGATPSDSVPSGAAKKDLTVITDAEGKAAIPLGPGELWNVRTLHAAVEPGGDATRWEVFFSTLVVHVAPGGHAGHIRPAQRESNGDVRLPSSTVASDSDDVADVVARFHAALAAGDSVAALALLSDDVTILESGGVESRAEYRSHHLPGDMAFARAIPGKRSGLFVRLRGEVAWVTSTSVTEGEFRGRKVNSTGAELAVLSREPGGWRIRAIHWSSRARR